MQLSKIATKATNKVTCDFRGRLGNQMFLAAATMAYAWEHGLKPVLSKRQITYVENPAHTGRNRVTKEFKNLPTTLFRSLGLDTVVTREPASGLYKPIPYFENHDVLIQGWRQSEKYFNKFRQDVLHCFAFDMRKTDYLRDKYRQYLEGYSVSMHVRRTDYLEIRSLKDLSEDTRYYSDALCTLEAKQGRSIDNILVFSDDLEWCQAALKMEHPTYFVREDADVDEMNLMSLCKLNIIANSAFSWWGAWLNCDRNRIVVAPTIWFDPGCSERSSKDLICNDWFSV